MKTQNIQAIQMIGTQRSGSNLLRVILNQHPLITAPHPPHILQRFIPLQTAYDSLQVKSNFELLVDDICRLVECNPVPWNNDRLDREYIMRKCETRSVTSIFKVIYDINAKTQNASHWLCKSMANVHFSKEIEAEFSPLYIHLVRDGRDVALSFKKAIVGEKHIYHLAQQWKKDQEACKSLRNNINPKRIIQVKYEDLIQNTESVMKNLLQFLNLDFDTAVLKYFNSKESFNTAKAGQMWSNVTQPVMSDNMRKFESGLTRSDIRIFENIAGSHLDLLKYERYFLPNVEYYDTMQVQHFTSINEKLKKTALKKTDPSDLKKRQRQAQLINEIKSRISVSSIFQNYG